MERMWRKVNHSLRSGTANSLSKTTAGGAANVNTLATPQSTDTVSSAGGFGDAQCVVAVAGKQQSASTSLATTAASTATGRRLASSGQQQLGGGIYQKSLSQHVLQTRTASSERRRRRRRKSRQRRTGGVTSCVGDAGADNMSSSGGFYTIKESSTANDSTIQPTHSNNQHPHQHQHQHYRHHNAATTSTSQMRHHRSMAASSRRTTLLASSAPSGTVMMYPNTQRTPQNETAHDANALATASIVAASSSTSAAAAAAAAVAAPDISLRQRAVAKLRMFNFHLNWDLHMTHCKPCGPRLSGSGNIITRRLCRNRRREDNELYRSNSFKFERFERKECLEELSNTLQKQIAICDDYSLPVDFVKKRPSSFDPCLAEAISTNPEHWVAPSPQTEFISIAEQQQPPPPPPSTLPQGIIGVSNLVPLAATSAAAAQTTLSTLPGVSTAILNNFSTAACNNNNNGAQNTLPVQQQQQQQQQQINQHKNTQRDTLQKQQQPPQPHPPLPNSNIKHASVKLIEGYSDPKDSRHHKKVYHKKAKRRVAHKKQQQPHRDQQQREQQPSSKQQQQQLPERYDNDNSKGNSGAQKKDKRNYYNSDSSAPKSSDDEFEDYDNQSVKVQDLNSPDSISDDLVRPLPPQLHRSPRKLTVNNPDHNKRNPSPYYYSDLLKSKESCTVAGGSSSAAADRETKNRSRQSTLSEPPQQTQPTVSLGAYRKSTSLDAPNEQPQLTQEANNDEDFDETEEATTTVLVAGPESGPILPYSTAHCIDSAKRYSFTEDGVHIIRCDSPTTTTSDESDCSECLKRREWHANALALVRKTCNVQPLPLISTTASGALELKHCDAGEGELLKCCPAPPTPLTLPPSQSQPQSQSLSQPAREALYEAEGDEAPSMPPHRLLGPAAVCACVAPPPNLGDDLDDYFRPRSIFYVHPHGVHECAECAPDTAPQTLNASLPAADNHTKSTNKAQSTNTLDLYGDDEGGGDDDDEEDIDEDIMAGRTRQIYETAFDCKIAKSDDDLDEVDRITNQSVLLQLNNGNVASTINERKADQRTASKIKSNRFEGKRLKNSKNQAIQEQATNSGSNASGESGTALAVVETELGNLQLHESSGVDQQNNATTTTTTVLLHSAPQPTEPENARCSSQLPIRGYTPSPPSTAPLPIKFPDKHERERDRFYMNSIKSAPNLPSTNPTHPRLRDLRLPIQSTLRQQQQLQCASSNDTSLTDSAYVNPPSLNSNAASGSDSTPAAAVASCSGSRTRNRPRSFVLESERVLELRRGGASHHHRQQQLAAASGGQQPAQQPHQQHHHHHRVIGSNGRRRTQHNYSSTESIATSSSGGSLESLRSSTSEGNRSTSSSESRHSTSLSSHSSESGSSSVAFPMRAPIVLHSKLHILSPISDKSSQEQASELSEQNKTQNVSPEEAAAAATAAGTTVAGGQHPQLLLAAPSNANIAGAVAGESVLSFSTQNKQRRAPPPNKALLHLADEILGSDSGISLHSREDAKQTSSSSTMGLQKLTLPKLNFPPTDKHQQHLHHHNSNEHSNATCNSSSIAGLPQDLRDLPFDMPKLRRRKTLQQEACTSGSATSVDLGDLPFDMPKLRRRLRANQAEINNLMMHSTESSGISQASSSHSMRGDDSKSGGTNTKLDTGIFRQNLTLNLNESRQVSKFGSMDLRGLTTNKEFKMNLSQSGFSTAVDLIDVSIPLERQGWYHGAITRIEAETTLRPLSEGSFLVRNCESTKQDYSLSLKGAKGFMHMRIQRNDTGQYILGQFSRPFDTVPDMIRHFCLNRLPVRGAEHMCLIEPVIAQLL